ncbi:MAG: hypothetical protein ACYC6M_04990 [Terriglobales bacterium]
MKVGLRPRKKGSGRMVAIKVNVARMTDIAQASGGAGGPFTSCVWPNRSITSRHGGGALACAAGRNPRQAIGKALAKAGRAIAKRSGAFAGLSKRRRRSRR